MIPKLLKLELTDRCNANCVFCSRAQYQPYGDMDIDMFKSIVDDFPEVREVQPQFFGEPMLHPQFFEALDFLKSRNKDIVFYTNGSLLNEEKGKVLAAIDPKEINFSIEADNKRDYENARKSLIWEEVLDNIKNFVRHKKNTRVVIRMCLTKENRERISEIKRFWEDIVCGKGSDTVCAVREKPVLHWREVSGHFGRKPGCKAILDEFTVKSNGNVVLCCLDWYGETHRGNVRDGARRIWEKEIDAAMIDKFCSKCSVPL